MRLKFRRSHHFCALFAFIPFFACTMHQPGDDSQSVAAAIATAKTDARGEKYWTPGLVLQRGESIATDRVRLSHQTDGNLVLSDLRTTRPLWNSETYNRPTAYLRFQEDGNLVLYGTQNEPIWHTSSFRTPTDPMGDPRLYLASDCNMILLDAGPNPGKSPYFHASATRNPATDRCLQQSNFPQPEGLTGFAPNSLASQPSDGLGRKPDGWINPGFILPYEPDQSKSLSRLSPGRSLEGDLRPVLHDDGATVLQAGYPATDEVPEDAFGMNVLCSEYLKFKEDVFSNAPLKSGGEYCGSIGKVNLNGWDPSAKDSFLPFVSARVWVSQWQYVEPVSGVRDLRLVEAMVEQLRVGGGKAVLILGAAPGWAGSLNGNRDRSDQKNHTGCGIKGFSCESPRSLEEYQSYVQAIMSRFKDEPTVTGYEVWNEPHTSLFYEGGSIQQLQDMTKIAYDTLQSNQSAGGQKKQLFSASGAGLYDPNFVGDADYYSRYHYRQAKTLAEESRIIAADSQFPGPRSALASLRVYPEKGEVSPRDRPPHIAWFMDNIINSDNGKAFDRLSYHVYSDLAPNGGDKREEEKVDSWMGAMKKVLRANGMGPESGGNSKPIAVTEFARHGGPVTGRPHYTPLETGSFLSRHALALLAAGAGSFHYFAAWDISNTGPLWSLNDPEVYASWLQTLEWTYKSKFISYEETADRTFRVITLTRNSQIARIVWRTVDEVTPGPNSVVNVSLPAGWGARYVADLNGQVTPVSLTQPVLIDRMPRLFY
jgi:hypothetical protein